MEGTEMKKVAPGVALTCISPAARNLLDTIMEEYKKHYADLKEVNPDAVTPDQVYGPFYWLCRYSGLIQPATPDKE